MILTELLYVAILPLAVAATIAFAAPRMRAKPPVTWATSVAIAYIAGQHGLERRTGDAFSLLLRPHEAADWLPHAVFLALGITILATLAPRPWRPVAIALAIALTVGLPLRLLHGSAYDLQWTLPEKLGYIALLSATLGLTWLTTATAPDADHPRLRAILLIVVASCTAVVVAFSGVFVYGEFCGVFAAAVTGTYVASQSQNVAALAGVSTVSLGSLILLSCFYAELTPTNAALLFFALLSATGRMPAFLSARPAWLKATLRIVLTMLPLAIAVAQTLATTQAQTTSNPYSL